MVRWKYRYACQSLARQVSSLEISSRRRGSEMTYDLNAGPSEPKTCSICFGKYTGLGNNAAR